MEVDIWGSWNHSWNCVTFGSSYQLFEYILFATYCFLNSDFISHYAVLTFDRQSIPQIDY